MPKLARLLRDGQGKFMYVGDSASLSFLQSVRRIVSSSIGDCDFTTDPMRHSILETAPEHIVHSLDSSPLDLFYDGVKDLAQQ